MRILLSTIGSRGEVEPVLALALQLRAFQQVVRICAPPDFRALIEAQRLEFVPIGPELRPLAASRAPALGARPSPERLAQLAKESMDAQFATVSAAAEGCELLVACGALQFAARSIAEHLRMTYVYASYCPITLPSPHHAPAVYGAWGQTPASETADHRALWQADAARWNAHFGALLNGHRAQLGLPRVDDVRSHIFTDVPWLAADATLAPWPEPSERRVLQTGAWMRADERALPAELAEFLDAGEPPIYFGFGSMRAPAALSRALVDSARALGRRALIASGWAELALPDAGADCRLVGEVNQQQLFRRVAAVVHHGGAGTTTAAARAGAAQVIAPQMYDQPYWARRIEQLGIGVEHAPGIPNKDSLSAALERAIAPELATRARTIAAAISGDGASVAARRMLEIA